MGNAARKARKRAGTPFQHPEKTPTPPTEPEPDLTWWDEGHLWLSLQAVAGHYGSSR